MNTTVTATVSCSTYTPNGTLKVNTVTGGSGSLQYSFILSNDPNYSDALSNYTSSNTFTVTQFGTYQVRIKDACGKYITKTVTIQSPYPAITDVTLDFANNQLCGSGNVELVQFSAYAGTTLVNLSTYDAPTGMPLKVEFWEGDATSCGGTVTAPATAPVSTFTIDSNYKNNHIIVPKSSTGYLIVRTTTPCGETRVFCKNVASIYNAKYDYELITSGCAPNEKFFLKGKQNNFMNFPVTVTIKNETTNTVLQTITINSTGDWLADQNSLNSWISNKFDLTTNQYSITYQDECGTVIQNAIKNFYPINAIVPAVSYTYNKSKCINGPLSQIGTTQIVVSFNKAYFTDFEHSTIKIISGPSNVGVAAVVENGFYLWNNVLPGDYEIEVANTCGTAPKVITFNVSSLPSSNYLEANLTSTATSFCSANGNITSTYVYNGGYTNTVQLLNSGGTVVGTSNTGTFSNIAAGTYTTRIAVTTTCGNIYYPGSTVTITNSTSGPVINNKSAVVCEPTGTTGNIYLNLSGASPLLLEYKNANDTTWTVFSANANNFETISNLPANQNYNIRLTSCGSSITESVELKPLNTIYIQNTVQPCYGKDYTLSGPNYVGATYVWKKNNVVLANTQDFTINNYNVSNDGQYILEVSWGTCLTKTDDININGALCGNPIGVIDAVDDNYSTLNNNALPTVISNDTLGGVPVSINDVTLSFISATNAGIAINTTTGIITVASNVPSGTYTLVYKICDKVTATTCDQANVTIVVPPYCYKPATTGVPLDTNQGITALGRAGAEHGNWPMVRKGAWTVLEAKTKGFVINRIASTALVNAIPNPIEGMMVYDEQADCLKINTDGTSSGWKCFTTQTCPN